MRLPHDDEIYTNLKNHAIYYLLLFTSPFFLKKAKVEICKDGWFGENWRNVWNTVQKEPIIVFSAHVGIPEIAGFYFSSKGLTIHVLVENVKSFHLKTLNLFRKKLGINPVSNPYHITKVLKEKRRKNVIVFLAERNIIGKGQKTEFFGEETILPYGPIKLSQIFNVKIFPFLCIRRNFSFKIYFFQSVSSFDEFKRSLENIISMSPLEWNTFWEFEM